MDYSRIEGLNAVTEPVEGDNSRIQKLKDSSKISDFNIQEFTA